MPKLGFGCWKLAGDVPALIEAAVEKGWRHFDCACDYGNEEKVGEGLARALAKGNVSRSDLWVTSKLWNTDHRKENVETACRKTLADLGLEYLDLYLIHFPISLKHVPHSVRYPAEWKYDPTAADGGKMELDPVPISETWAAMEDLVQKGLVKNIGVCNFSAVLLTDLLSYAKIPPACLQVELHPFLPQNRLLSFCKGRGIPVVAFSPLGSSSYIELGMDVEDNKGALDEAAVVEIATRLQATPAQVLLAWHMRRGTAAIPKTSNVERLAENLAASTVTITDEDASSIDALASKKQRRYNDPGVFAVGMGGDTPIYD